MAKTIRKEQFYAKIQYIPLVELPLGFPWARPWERQLHRGLLHPSFGAVAATAAACVVRDEDHGAYTVVVASDAAGGVADVESGVVGRHGAAVAAVCTHIEARLPAYAAAYEVMFELVGACCLAGGNHQSCLAGLLHESYQGQHPLQ